MTIGQRFSALRKAKGYTQEYIAEQLSVSRQAVSKWEKDQTSPDTSNMIALSKLLDSTVEYIAVGTINQPNKDDENSTHSTKSDLHNRYITLSAFFMFIGLGLTFLFPLIGPIFIAVGIIFWRLAATLEQ